MGFFANKAIKACYNIADLQELARKNLPPPFFDLLDGGADDEVTLRRNTQAFESYDLLPRTLVDVGKIDTSTTVLGQEIKWPVYISPSGGSRLFHHQGERAIARAAARSGTLYSLAMFSTVSLEEVAKESNGPKMYQMYMLRDKQLNIELIERCRLAGYVALCFTVDCAVHGNHTRTTRSGLALRPPRLTLKSKLQVAIHPQWLWHYLVGAPMDAASFVDVENVRDLLDPCVTWDDVAPLIEQWNGPVAIKGILNVDDAKRAVDIGATAIVVSSHGGRQLDGVAAPIDVLSEIVQAVGDRCEVILDSGVRRGTHILKALALGAKACTIGRPYLYGLAAGGEAGVDRALDILRSEVERGMALMGCRRLSDLSPNHVRRRLP